MRRAFVRVVLLCATLAFTTGTARADIPEPPHVTIPELIAVVGHDAGGLADPIGHCTVVVRDIEDNPIAGSLVVLDFGNCVELRLCADDHDPNAIVDCPTRTVRKFTDANGVATFRVIGWSAGGLGAPENSARIYADGLLMGYANVAIYDLSGGGGLAPPDLSAWLEDYFGGANPARADYDDSGLLGPSDLAKWLTAFFGNGSIQNCVSGTACP